jgi:hypothetical protein
MTRGRAALFASALWPAAPHFILKNDFIFFHTRFMKY